MQDAKNNWVRNTLEESRRRDPRAVSRRSPPGENCWHQIPINPNKTNHNSRTGNKLIENYQIPIQPNYCNSNSTTGNKLLESYQILTILIELI